MVQNHQHAIHVIPSLTNILSWNMMSRLPYYAQNILGVDLQGPGPWD